MTNDKSNGVITEPKKQLPEPLPDLTRARKLRARTEISRITDRPLFSVISMLTAEGVSMSLLDKYLPADTDPLMVEYRKVLARHAESPTRRPIQINPTRRWTASATA